MKFSALGLLGALWLLCGSWVAVAQKAPTVVVAPSSGKDMCSALTADDFSKAGVQVSRLREANLDSEDNAYCVYESKAGKVEFDIFFPAGSSTDEIKSVERTVLAEVGGKFEPVPIAGIEEAQTNVVAPKDRGSATMAVRSKKAVFDINIPQGQNARQQLIALAKIVATRLKQ